MLYILRKEWPTITFCHIVAKRCELEPSIFRRKKNAPNQDIFYLLVFGYSASLGIYVVPIGRTGAFLHQTLSVKDLSVWVPCEYWRFQLATKAVVC